MNASGNVSFGRRHRRDRSDPIVRCRQHHLRRSNHVFQQVHKFIRRTRSTSRGPPQRLRCASRRALVPTTRASSGIGSADLSGAEPVSLTDKIAAEPASRCTLAARSRGDRTLRPTARGASPADRRSIIGSRLRCRRGHDIADAHQRATGLLTTERGMSERSLTRPGRTRECHPRLGPRAGAARRAFVHGQRFATAPPAGRRTGRGRFTRQSASGRARRARAC